MINVTLYYNLFTLASIYYDPSLNIGSSTFFVENTPEAQLRMAYSDSSKLSADYQYLSLSTRNDVQYPPYNDSIWNFKDIRGLHKKEALFKALLNKLQQENDSKSLQKLDLEYEKFKATTYQLGQGMQLDLYLFKNKHFLWK